MKKLRMPLKWRIRLKWDRLLDTALGPITNSLTDAEYYSCNSRADVLRTYIRKML